MKIEIEIENGASLVMDNNSTIWIHRHRGQDLIRLNLYKGKLTIICFRPVKIINQFEDKKSEAGHET